MILQFSNTEYVPYSSHAQREISFSKSITIFFKDNMYVPLTRAHIMLKLRNNLQYFYTVS